MSEPRDWNWKINETLLKEPEYEKQIAQELDSFFAINETGEVTPFCVWEKHKCVIRGTFMTLGAHKKKAQTALLDSLLGEIRAFELIHKKSQTHQIEEKLFTRGVKSSTYGQSKS